VKIPELAPDAFAPPSEGDEDTRPYLPDELWLARPLLTVIRDAARSRLLAPDALLGAVLARVAACSPHTLELPPIVGSPKGLSYFTILVGNPEAGKSATADVAGELIPAPLNVLDRLPPGSGEGMVEALFDLVDEDDENGKKRKVKRQTKYAAVFHVDEGAVLAELAGRAGSTLMPTLRSAWSHSTLGNTNASAERRRILDGRAYVFGVTVGVQPEWAAPIVDDVAAGTPQRFLWLMATHPDLELGDVAWPGPLDWQPHDAGTLEPIATNRGGWRRHTLHVPDRIAVDVRAHRANVMRGADTDPRDAHSVLMRLKTAALLALLDHRLALDDDDWRLAGIILDTSRRVRGQVEGTIAWLADRKEQAASDRHARREIHVEDTKAERALRSAARSVANVVHKHADRDAHEQQGGGCTKRCLTHAIAGKHRDFVTVDQAADEAERSRWISASSDRWTPGQSRPA
jgi:hypothetical protein